MPPTGTIQINRAPVLTLWASIVAERLGFDRDEALTLGKAVAGLNAYSKGVRLGLFEPASPEMKQKRAALRSGETIQVDLLGRAVPATRTPDGLRALDKERPADPAKVQAYLEGKFGEALPAVRDAMEELAAALPAESLAERAFGLYEAFRPEIPPGKRGWGATGALDLGKIRSSARKGRR